VTSVFTGYPDVFEQLNSGKLRALAVASLSRIEPLPNVPTVAESGYKGYEAEFGYGVVAPAKTRKETVAQLADLFATALQAPKAKAELIAQGLFPVGKCGAEFGNFIRKQYDEYGRIIRELHSARTLANRPVRRKKSQTRASYRPLRSKPIERTST
jgi:tripartite-type tricarboxylate transporter receptor subunit TctC